MPESSLSHVSREDLDHLYNEQGLTTEEIGEVLGVSDDVVLYRLKQLGIPRRDKSEAAHMGMLPSHPHKMAIMSLAVT